MDERKADVTENAEIGNRIRLLCEYRKMSFQELARQADISQAVLYNILSGNANPRLSTLQLICGALDISLEQLFSSKRSREPVTAAELKMMIKSLDENERQMLKMYLELLYKIKKQL